MFLILTLVAVCGAIPLQEFNKNEVDQKVLLQNDTHLHELKVINSYTDKDSIKSESAVQTYLVNLIKSKSEPRIRRKRFIARSGMCPNNYVMMPKPIGCISCEEYKDITDRDC